MGSLELGTLDDDATSDPTFVDVEESITWIDFVGLVVAFGLCVGSISASSFSAWSPRVATMLLALPLGSVLLLQLVRRRDPAGLVLGVGVLWLLISLAFHTAPFMRLFGRLGMEASVLIYVAAISIWAIGRGLSDAGRRLLPWVITGGLALNGLVGILQVLLDIESGPFALYGARAHGLTRYSVYFGAMMTIGVALAAAWTPPRRLIGIQLLAVVYFATAGGLSGSRAVVLGSVGATGYLFATRRTRAAFGCVLAAIGGTVMGSLLVSRLLGEATDEVDGGAVLDRFGVTGDGAGGIGWRLDGWLAGFDAWIERPIAGWGVGNFRQAVATRLDPFDVDRSPRFDAHNIVVELAVATGIVGLAIALIFVVLAARSARGPMAIAAAVTASIWLLQPADTGTLGLTMLLVGAAWGRGEANEVASARSSRVAGVAVIVGLVIGSAFLIGDLRLKRAVDALDTATIESYADVVWFDPVLSDFAAQANAHDWVLNGLDPALADRTIDWSERTIERQPDAAIWFDNLGMRHVLFHQWTEARAVLEQALEMQPNRPGTLEAMQYLARESEDDQLLEEVTERLCEMKASYCPD